MNCDNFLSDRPSTRVRAPPGGASSISFGADPAPAPAARARAAPAPSGPAPWEVREEPTRRTPHHTSSSIVFGSDVKENTGSGRAAPASKPYYDAEPRAPAYESRAAPEPAHAAPAPAAAAAAAAPGGRVSSNVFASGANQNCGNFITDRPTTRLHAPPGGKSSFTLG